MCRPDQHVSLTLTLVATLTLGPDPDSAPQHLGCMPALDMEALYAALPSRNRELWALIRLTEAMAQADSLSGAVCAQERGALAYQVSG